MTRRVRHPDMPGPKSFGRGSIEQLRPVAFVRTLTGPRECMARTTRRGFTRETERFSVEARNRRHDAGRRAILPSE